MQTVQNAGRRLRSWLGKTATPKNFAANAVKALRIENVKPLDYVEDVWCLTVPSVGHFSLSNGAVVKNCSHAADAFRVLAMGRRRRPKFQDRPDKAQDNYVMT